MKPISSRRNLRDRDVKMGRGTYLKTNTFSPLLQRIPKGEGQVLPCSGQNRFTKMEPSPFPFPELMTPKLIPPIKYFFHFAV